MTGFGSSFTYFALALATFGLKVASYPSTGDAPSFQQNTDDVQFLQVATHRINVTEKAPAFGYNDSLRFFEWTRRSAYSGKEMPRVLLYTWCDQDGLLKFANEFYWKACYAHMHGYHVVISSAKNFSGVKAIPPYNGPYGEFVKWYQPENMWAWVNDIRTHLSSGQYDYVFLTGSDVLINKVNLWFPLWLYDRGHDITVMDQDTTAFGLNENGMLFKASSASVDFLNEFFEYRKDYWVQTDNGAWMELLLQTIGRKKHEGYKSKCTSLCKLEQAAPLIDANEPQRSVELNTKYAECFFQELDHLAGPFGQRSSQTIGFSKAGLEHGDELPWANCFSYIRDKWPNCDKNCFAFHWNGPKKKDDIPPVDATCPDPSFQWNPASLSYEGKPAGRIHMGYSY